MTRKSKFLTFIFSFIPGVGHLYLGLTKRGLQLMIGAFLCITLISVVPIIFPFVLAVIWFYSLFDALQKVNLMNEYIARGQDLAQDQFQGENANLSNLDQSILNQLRFTQSNNLIEPFWLGIGCILIGILILVRISFPDIWYWLNQVHFGSTLLAIVLVGFGIWLIRKQSLK